jgi:hypothetical protein
MEDIMYESIFDPFWLSLDPTVNLCGDVNASLAFN